MKIVVLFFLASLAGCGQEPVGDTKKLPIMGSRTVSKLVEKGTRVFGKTLERAKTVFMPEGLQLELAIPEGSLLELPSTPPKLDPVSDKKTWLSKDDYKHESDWLSANYSLDEDYPPGSPHGDRQRELNRRKQLSEEEQRRLAEEDEYRRRKYREEVGEYTGKHGQPQPPW